MLTTNGKLTLVLILSTYTVAVFRCYLNIYPVLHEGMLLEILNLTSPGRLQAWLVLRHKEAMLKIALLFYEIPEISGLFRSPVSP